MSAVTIIDMQKGCGATILSAELKSDFGDGGPKRETVGK
jgi:hypothetical protein